MPTLKIIPPLLDRRPNHPGRASMRVPHWRIGVTQLMDIETVMGQTNAEEGAVRLRRPPPSSRTCGTVSRQVESVRA